MGSARTRRWASLAMMLASGFAGLGYQIIWSEDPYPLIGATTSSVEPVRH